MDLSVTSVTSVTSRSRCGAGCDACDACDPSERCRASGTLRHQGQSLIERVRNFNDEFYFPSEEHLRERDRHWAEMLLHEKDWSGKFTVDDFSVPLTAKHVVAVQWKKAGEHPALDFTVGSQGTVTVRVTFLEHKLPSGR